MNLAAPKERRFSISGMDCASCARSVEKGVGSLAGVEGCEVDFTTARLRLQGEASSDLIVRRIRDLGFDAAPENAPGSAPGSTPGPGTHAPAGGSADGDSIAASAGLLRFLLRRRSARPALAGAILLAPGLVFHEILGWEGGWIEVPALAAVLIAGAPVLRAAWRGLRINRELNIQALMAIAVIGALVIGAWVEAGMVVVLFSIGEALEGYAAARARGAIQGLMTVAPDRASLIERNGIPVSGRPLEPVEALTPGDVILVHPGERLPMDGIVRAGSSFLDRSALTGESVPQDVEPGTEVLAGSVNGEGALEVVVSRPASETTLHRMIRLVEEAHGSRAPIQRFIDRFARLYTPVVVALAAFVAVVPPLALGAPFWNPDPATFGWFYRALALLVVACPCALVISVPASVVSALTNAARSGVLIKGGAHLEALAGVRAVAFDKTGTLTEGALTVVGVRSVDCAARAEGSGPCEACDDLLALAAAVEQRSEHPVGRAVAEAAHGRLESERIPDAVGHRALTGSGVTALLSGSGQRVTIGSHRHFDLHVPHDGEHCREANAHAAEGRIPVLVEMDGRFLGTITLADVPRPTARQALRELDEMGIATILLSGDSEPSARFIAERVGIRTVRADLFPEQKMEAVRALEREYGSVSMVGDGINDAPALAAVEVGIAVGGDLGGTDQAREAAAITLMNRDLRVLPGSIRLARATMRTVRTNVAFAVAIKVAFLALILAGKGTLWMAVLADVGATILVTLWGMRLLRWKGMEALPQIASPSR